MRDQVDLDEHDVDDDLQVFDRAHQLTQPCLQEEVQDYVENADSYYGLRALGHCINDSFVFNAQLSYDFLLDC